MSAERPRRPAPAWDAPLTVALLVAGVFNVTVTVANMRMLPETLEEGYALQKVGPYTAIPLASAMGACGIAAAMLALVVAIGVSVPRLRAHRLTFWVPLVAAAASLVLTTTFVAIAVFGDPAGAAYLQQSSGL